MVLEIIRGESKNPRATELADRLARFISDGDLYLGYPVLATTEDRVQVDALLVSPSYGLIAFQIADDQPVEKLAWQELIEEQNRLYAVLESHLGRHPSLRKGRQLAFELYTITVFGQEPEVPVEAKEGIYCGVDVLQEAVTGLGTIEESVMFSLQSVLQRVSTLKPANKRATVTIANSRGSKLKEIEKSIANLDHWQSRAAIETPPGPQRIRGLAGSGKTIVLALKAAYLHSQHPEWRIAVTFQSRTLYQQFESLITRFTSEHMQDTPDFNMLSVMHAWGSSNRSGFYQTIASSMGVAPRDYFYAQQRYGFGGAFRGVCAELLEIAEASDIYEPLFDAVLIDEAQDFPSEFFRLVYRFTKDPKRIVWGYDELQKLSEASMPSMVDMFGTASNGNPLVSLAQVEGEAARDIILPTCYRNSNWSLAIAHALGYGIYRAKGLVQHFDDPNLWTQVGYSVVDGTLAAGQPVSLERSGTSTPEFFGRLLDATDAVAVCEFSSELVQDEWIADEIKKNLEVDELEATDILIVLPSASAAKGRALSLRGALQRRGIISHLVGVNSSADEMTVQGSVTIAHVHRAKGNEAAMVYAVDAHLAAADDNPVTRRNILFTSITRSKAWVRICGYGEGMSLISEEIEKVRAAGYKLNFKIPSRLELDVLRHQDRSKTKEDIQRIRSVEENLKQIIQDIDSNKISIRDVPEWLRTQVADRMQTVLDMGETEIGDV